MIDYRKAFHTFTFLSIEHDRAEPEEVTAILGIPPTQSARRGQTVGKSSAPLAWNVWVLSSLSKVQSRDNSEHIEWLIASVGSSGAELGKLREHGHRIKIHCVWIGKGGYGGPRLSPAALRGLANLGLEVWFDVGFIGQENAPTT
jgi:hypothetical protein